MTTQPPRRVRIKAGGDDFSAGLEGYALTGNIVTREQTWVGVHLDAESTPEFILATSLEDI